MYHALKWAKELDQEQLEFRIQALRELHKIHLFLRLRSSVVLEAQMSFYGYSQCCTVCPPAFREMAVWQTYILLARK